MHNLKEIRKNFENFRKTLENRSVDIDFLSSFWDHSGTIRQ